MNEKLALRKNVPCKEKITGKNSCPGSFNTECLGIFCFFLIVSLPTFSLLCVLGSWLYGLSPRAPSSSGFRCVCPTGGTNGDLIMGGEWVWVFIPPASFLLSCFSVWVLIILSHACHDCMFCDIVFPISQLSDCLASYPQSILAPMNRQESLLVFIECKLTQNRTSTCINILLTL